MSNKTLPKEVISSISGKRLALIGFEREEAADLASALESVEVFTRAFDQTVVLPGDEVLRHSDLVIVKIERDASSIHWIAPDDLAKNNKPLLFIGPSEMLFQHVPTSQPTPYDLLISPWHPEEIVLRVYHVLSEAAKISAKKVVIANGKPRVLIADDDATTTLLVSSALTNSGLECETASDGGEAVEVARRTLPNAAILDVNMPHLSGFEVLTALKSDPKTSPIRVIMLTSRQQEADIIRAFGLGADDYVVKPFNPMELTARLKRILS